MFFKIVCVFALVAVALAQDGYKHEHKHEPAHSSQYIHKHDGHAEEVVFTDKHGHKHVDYYTHPKYEFKYNVEDKHTGDIKSHHETRDGHDTKSDYTVHSTHHHHH